LTANTGIFIGLLPSLQLASINESATILGNIIFLIVCIPAIWLDPYTVEYRLK